MDVEFSYKPGSETEYHDNFRHFTNVLNKKFFGNAWTRHGKGVKTRVISQNPHRVTFEVPIDRTNDKEFFDDVCMIWSSRTRFGLNAKLI